MGSIKNIINKLIRRIIMSNIKLFPCYSIPLMKFLTVEKEIRYKLEGLNPKSKTHFYVFIDDEQLNNALIEWRETKPSV